MMVETIEDRRIVNKSVGPLSRQLGFDPEWADQYLTNPPTRDMEILHRTLEHWQDSQVRHDINVWWRTYRHILPGKLTNLHRASQLPESTYKQIIVLKWLTFAIEREKVLRRDLPVITQPVAQPVVWLTRANLWVRILRWLEDHWI